MALYSQDGIKFENEEVAINWFLSTLSETTPLGEKYEKLHEHDWKSYSLQATGINEMEMHLFLDNADLKNNIFKRINYNTYGTNENKEVKEVIKELEAAIKAIEIAHVAYMESLYKVKEKLKNEDNDTVMRFTDFNKVVTTIQIEKTITSEELIIALTDEVTGKQSHIKVGFNNYGRLEVEKIKHRVFSLFSKSTEGEFDIGEGTIGDCKVDDLIDYAVENNKKLKLEIID